MIPKVAPTAISDSSVVRLFSAGKLSPVLRHRAKVAKRERRQVPASWSAVACHRIS